MGSKKKRKSKHKQFWGLPKEVRLEKAKTWIETYDGENIVKAYAKAFKLNISKALKELQSIGVKISTQEKEQINNMIKARQLQKENKKAKREAQRFNEFEDFDDTFAFIAGYTEGGAPYGITYEEMEEIERAEKQSK